jgi:hypothetical protein
VVVLRFLGRLFIALALATMVAGITIWLLGIDIMAKFGQIWANADIASINFAQVVVQRHLRIPAFWDSVIVPYLLLRPTWEAMITLFILFLVLGALLLRLGRRRRTRRGAFD